MAILGRRTLFCIIFFSGKVSGQWKCVIGLVRQTCRLGCSLNELSYKSKIKNGIKFLQPGPRYGGSCFQKDTRSLSEAKKMFSDIENSLSFFENEYEAMSGAGALVILTEWKQYINLDFERVKKLLASPVIFDLRNLYKRMDMEEKGFSYYAVGQ